MAETSHQYNLTGLSRLKLFWALSRTPHGLLDMSTAALGALLWLGHFPSLKIIGLGLITVFAGYTAVYALNDLVDYRSDKKKLLQGQSGAQKNYRDLDAVFVGHPMACGFLSLKEGLLWAVAWALLALIGAYLLNPVCALIFICACILETAYCLMWKISPSRTLINGVVKTTGPIAAVFAVDPNPSWSYLIALFLLLFFWEIGGQNVPNDWVDLEEDKRFNAQTIPIRLGIKWAKVIIISSIILTLVFTVILLPLSHITFELPYLLGFMSIGAYLLLIPAVKLYKTEKISHAMALFNKASYYPLLLLIVIVIKLLV
jgi:4-hydroxybenzoate polyprenyltransferase